jgi:hypothetical protein
MSAAARGITAVPAGAQRARRAAVRGDATGRPLGQGDLFPCAAGPGDPPEGTAPMGARGVALLPAGAARVPSLRDRPGETAAAMRARHSNRE